MERDLPYIDDITKEFLVRIFRKGYKTIETFKQEKK